MPTSCQPAVCSSCRKTMPVRLDGMIRIHGPAKKRCEGSGRPSCTQPRAVLNDPEATNHIQSRSPQAIISPRPNSQRSPTQPTPVADDPGHINPGRVPQSMKILKCIPRGSRELAAQRLSQILDDVVVDNSPAAWERLYLFPRRCLFAPIRGGHRRNLTSIVKENIREECAPSYPPPPSKPRTRSNDPLKNLANRVSSKLEEGNFKGAVRLAASDDMLAPDDDHTLLELKLKHPSRHAEATFPPARVPSNPLVFTEAMVFKAIATFPTGSAPGPDGFRPQFLKDLLSSPAGEGSRHLITSLTAFVNMVASGDVPPSVQSFFFGANLTALNKKGGGVRPIAVGNTFRRLVAKCSSAMLKPDMGDLLAPLQLGYGTPNGAETAVHSARRYLSTLDNNSVMVKLDFRNAFNSIRRDKMLDSVWEHAPEIYPLVYAAYRNPSLLFFGSSCIHSEEGVQQGDPLGPLLFCLAVHHIVNSLKSDFKVFYLDDGTLGGSLADVQEDLATVANLSKEIGLTLNQSKCEALANSDAVLESLQQDYPSFVSVDPAFATLLGSPIGGMDVIDSVLKAKVDALRLMGTRLKLLHAHDALCLLRNAFSLPKVLYILRSAPCFASSVLPSFDDTQRQLLESICNVNLDDQAWTQASLPVSAGGLGIRSATQLAPSAFLASAAGSAQLSTLILPSRCATEVYAPQGDALRAWECLFCPNTDTDPPSQANAHKQKFWDTPVVHTAFMTLLDGASPTTRARLLAAERKESGAWLGAPPMSSVGLRMEDSVITSSIGLRLGIPLCTEHKCLHCGAMVDRMGTHGLSCRKSQGRLPRHSALNSIVKRALSSIGIPSILEPQGVCRDGGRPDGITVTPWSGGKALVWDVTCHDTYAPSYVHMAGVAGGNVADQAARDKRRIYAELKSPRVRARRMTDSQLFDEVVQFLVYHQCNKKCFGCLKDLPDLSHDQHYLSLTFTDGKEHSKAVGTVVVCSDCHSKEECCNQRCLGFENGWRCSKRANADSMFCCQDHTESVDKMDSAILEDNAEDTDARNSSDRYRGNIREAVWSKSGGQCHYCEVPLRKDSWQADHYKPVAHGGRTTLANGVASCAPCNLSKGVTHGDVFKRNR